MKLRYPITKEYPWHYFTPLALTLSVFMLVILTVINVIAVGYETVTVVRDDFNSTQRHWWSPFLPEQMRKPTCDAHQFAVGDVFYTAGSTPAGPIFEYRIIDASNNKLSYSNVPLGEVCNFMEYTVNVDRAQRTVLSSAFMGCWMDDGTGVLIQLSHITEILPPGVTFGMGRAEWVVSGLAMDLLVGVLAESATGTAIDALTSSAIVSCDGLTSFNDSDPTPPQAEVCANTPIDLLLGHITVAYANGSLVRGDLSLAPLEASFLNVLHAVVAASFMDINIWKNNSIFSSLGMFNATISPNFYIDMVLKQNRLYSSYYGDLNGGGELSSASYFRANPDKMSLDLASGVIDISYLCHDQRLKGTFSLIGAVIVADASIFATFWAAFTLIASYYASRVDAAISDSHEKEELLPV